MKRTTYTGGEDFKQSELLPKDFDRFFNKRLFYLLLAILSLLVMVLI